MGSVAAGLGAIGNTLGQARELAQQDAEQKRRAAIEQLYARLQQQAAARSDRALMDTESQQEFERKRQSQPIVVRSFTGADRKTHAIVQDPITGKFSEQILGGEEADPTQQKLDAFQRIFKRPPTEEEQRQIFGIGSRSETLADKYSEAEKVTDDLISKGMLKPSQRGEYIRSLLPNGSAATKIIFPSPTKGGAGTYSDEQIDTYGTLLATNGISLDQLAKVFVGKTGDELRSRIVTNAIGKGWNPNAQITPAAQKTIMQIDPTLKQVDRLVSDIDNLGLAKNNKSGYLALARLQYSLGRASPEGSLGNDIAGLSLGSVVEAASALMGSSRSISALKIALQHTPNAWVDSPALLREKLTTIKARLQDVLDDARRYGTKTGLENTQQGTDDTSGWTPVQ